MSYTNVVSTVIGRATGSVAGLDVGVATLAVRDDVLSTLTPADGAYTPLRVNSQGALHVASSVANSGALSNLFDAQVISLAGTASAAVDVSASSRANLFVHGSDNTAFTSFDVFVSPDSTTWLYAGAMFTNATDGGGIATIGRSAYLSMDVAGINWVQVRAYTSETVTASCFSS